MKKFVVAFLVTAATWSLTFCLGQRVASGELITSRPAQQEQQHARAERDAQVVRTLLVKQYNLSQEHASACVNMLAPQEVRAVASAPVMLQNAGTVAYAIIFFVIGMAIVFYIFWTESNTQTEPAGPLDRNPSK
ncbi:MAG: hypothetical protein RDV41_14385 [Planctomycetota bacterium]|nr:hypothetical protein [Planctomycetota bacterium]